MKEDIRWKQRFDNFGCAFKLLQSALTSRVLDDFSDLEQEGIIQRFEYTFELAWKTMKDYLENSGLLVNSRYSKSSDQRSVCCKNN
jgi:nucleotidyltransferase substrate binding protein (TIGR01987 family)